MFAGALNGVMGMDKEALRTHSRDKRTWNI